MASARLLKEEPGSLPHLGHSGVSHPGFPCCFLQKSPETLQHPASENTSQPFGLVPPPSELSQILRTSELILSLSLYQDPHLPPLTHRKPQKRTLRPPTSPVCLPGKLHPPPTDQAPDPSLPLAGGGLRGCGDKRCLESAMLSPTGRREGGGPQEADNGRRSANCTGCYQVSSRSGPLLA